MEVEGGKGEGWEGGREKEETEFTMSRSIGLRTVADAVKATGAVEAFMEGAAGAMRSGVAGARDTEKGMEGAGVAVAAVAV